MFSAKSQDGLYRAKLPVEIDRTTLYPRLVWQLNMHVMDSIINRRADSIADTKISGLTPSSAAKIVMFTFSANFSNVSGSDSTQMTFSGNSLGLILPIESTHKFIVRKYAYRTGQSGTPSDRGYFPTNVIGSSDSSMISLVLRAIGPSGSREYYFEVYKFDPGILNSNSTPLTGGTHVSRVKIDPSLIRFPTYGTSTSIRGTLELEIL